MNARDNPYENTWRKTLRYFVNSQKQKHRRLFKELCQKLKKKCFEKLPEGFLKKKLIEEFLKEILGTCLQKREAKVLLETLEALVGMPLKEFSEKNLIQFLKGFVYTKIPKLLTGNIL